VARFRDTDEFGPTVDAVAERLDISATAVEKDYWVSEVLRVLAAAFPDDFIFKGGTSLSKGYRIVERFSEDIDVLVLPGQRGRGAVDKLMKAMGEVAAAGVGGEATGVGGAESGRHRSFAVSYPAGREPTALIATSVLLEMGVRGGPQPHERVGIGCLLGDALGAAGTDLAEYEDLAPFEVTVLHPARPYGQQTVARPSRSFSSACSGRPWQSRPWVWPSPRSHAHRLLRLPAGSAFRLSHRTAGATCRQLGHRRPLRRGGRRKCCPASLPGSTPCCASP
jgi:hypothetical protein